VSFASNEVCNGMVQVKVVLCDDEGNVLSGTEEHLYSLGQDCQRLDDIEQAVETWRHQALPQLESDLLHRAQTQFTDQLKKQEQPPATASDESV
ncbi:MAG: hypothetical protein AAFY57_17810, partial [Cyanobacteria bacterium J06642_2]